jgi:hypothetical protein
MNPVLGSMVVALTYSEEAQTFTTTLAPLLDIGLSTILIGLVVWFVRQREKLISTGEWVPRRELDYIREDRDTRLTQASSQCADWRAAHETSERARELQAQQTAQLIEALRAQERFFDAFRSIIERNERDRDNDVEP